LQRTIKLGFLLLLVTIAQLLGAAGFSVESQVDRAEVGFGESFNLVVTLSQDLSSGSAQRLSMPAIESIPGFDIASTRSGQSTSFINGVGQTRSQIVYELVPQQPGKAVIPAFSFQDSSGESYTTKPIEINVLAPDDKPAEQPAEKAAEPQASLNNRSNDSFYRGLLLAGLILGCIVALPFVLSAFFNRNVKPSTRWKDSEKPVGKESAPGASAKNPAEVVEDAQIVDDKQFIKTRPAKIDFAAAIARLKREYPDADIVFYGRYFATFKDAMLGNSTAVSPDMTMDELFAKVCSISGREDITAACKRLAGDLELVLYANRPPSRGFSNIDTDAREILNAISE